MPGETFITICGCTAAPGTVAPSIAPYVVSLNGLYGIVTLAGTGAIELTSLNNVITIGLSAAAGLGSVTSVALASGNSNLTIADSPITTNGTITLDLAGNLDSISGLVMAADQMLYSTGAATFTTTSLPAFGRTLIANASAADARTDLGLVIGTDVQAFSSDLSAFVTNASWAGADLTLSGALTVGGAGGLTVTTSASVGGDLGVTGDINCAAGTLTIGAVNATTLSGDGSAITAITAANISAGTLAVARGGTGLASYTVGQVLYASGATTIAGLTAGAAGTFLRFAGAGVAPVVSTLILPNAATTGDIFMATSSNTMGRLANVATGNVLLSGGVSTASTFGKVTSGHVDSTIATLSAGVNSNIGTLAGISDITGDVTFSGFVSFGSEVRDGSNSAGNSGDILTSTGLVSAWTNQIAVSTIRVDGLISSEATITAAGVTGAQTINKMTGTVRFAAAASSLIITNSLALAASTRALATVCTNDTTLKTVCAVVTDGFITLTANAAATSECEVFFELRGLT